MRGPAGLKLDTLTPTVIHARRVAAMLDGSVQPDHGLDEQRHWFRRSGLAGVVAEDLAIARTPEFARHPLAAEAMRLHARLMKIKHHACGQYTRDFTTKDLSQIREY